MEAELVKVKVVITKDLRKAVIKKLKGTQAETSLAFIEQKAQVSAAVAN
jgi:hypothetical protein